MLTSSLSAMALTGASRGPPGRDMIGLREGSARRIDLGLESESVHERTVRLNHNLVFCGVLDNGELLRVYVWVKQDLGAKLVLAQCTTATCSRLTWFAAGLTFAEASRMARSLT